MKMKKHFYLIVGLLLATSCNKFLDLKPQSQIDMEDLFTTEQGFKEALNGVYTICASQSLYGGNLTFGNLDIIAQNYQFTDVTYQNLANFDYGGDLMKGANNAVWANGYKAIVNDNTLLSAIDKNPSIFSGNSYSLIKGEALALRAYLHFDLLRMFAPSYKAGANLKGIPYVTSTGVQSTPFTTVSATIDKIIADLQTAKALLKKSDPIVFSDYVVGYPSNPDATETSSQELFMQNRRHRINYFTVCGELARVYLYKNDAVNSLLNAQEVIDSKRFPFTSQDDFFQTDIVKRDRIFYNELISAWYIDTKDINTMLTARFANSNPTFSATADQIKDIYEIAQVGGQDWRLKQWFLTQSAVTGGPDRSILQKYYRNAAPLTNIHPLMAPAMRLSEMYYIAAEATFDINPSKALEYFNTLRTKRGIGNAVTSVPNKDAFIDLLLKDARKEFYGESQIFYMYKRLHHAITVSATQVKQPSTSIFVFPLPEDENAYRNN
jgi:starch-binding outer membrane protein, SusD/RagB family